MSIYFLEGIPGSGKTTLSKRLAEKLIQSNHLVELYNEGDLHPLDLAWCSITSNEVFQNLCKKYPKVIDQIKQFSTKEKGQWITAYTKVIIPDEYKGFHQDFEKYEIYRTDDLDKFKNEHIKRWKLFAEKANPKQDYVFECVFLQNHINELLLKFNLDESNVKDYFKDLINTLESQEVKVFYVYPNDVDNRIRTVASERRTNNKNLYKDWLDSVMDYMKNTRYAKLKKYLGYDGFIRYLHDRIAIELKVLKVLPVKTYVMNLDGDFEKVFNCILKESSK